jgi:hypothetical protein
MESSVVCQYLDERTGFHAMHICACLNAIFGSIVGICIQWHVYIHVALTFLAGSSLTGFGIQRSKMFDLLPCRLKEGHVNAS